MSLKVSWEWFGWTSTKLKHLDNPSFTRQAPKELDLRCNLLESTALLHIMDEMRQMLASIGLGNLSPTQLASVLDPEKMATLEQMDGLRSLRAQAPEDDTESFIRERTQEIKHAKEMLEASRRHAPDSRS